MAKSKKKEDKEIKTTDPDLTGSEEKIIPVGTAEKSEAEGQGAETSDESPEPIADEMDQLKARVKELEDQKLRALAELDNFRKRSARQLQDTIRSSNDRLLSEMLEIVDNFERALQHRDEGGHEANHEAYRKGTELIYSQMMDLLARYDVKPIESVGKPFDPNLHEALMPVASDEYDEGTVAVEISKGYRQGDRVLRHAKVGVSQGPDGGSDKDREGASQ